MTRLFIWDKDLSPCDLFGRRSQEVLLARIISQRSAPSSRSPVWTTRIYTCLESPAASVGHPSRVSCLVGLGVFTSSISLIGCSPLLGGMNSPGLAAASSHQGKLQGKGIQVLACGSHAGFSEWWGPECSGYSTDSVCHHILPWTPPTSSAHPPESDHLSVPSQRPVCTKLKAILCINQPQKLMKNHGKLK